MTKDIALEQARALAKKRAHYNLEELIAAALLCAYADGMDSLLSFDSEEAKSLRADANALERGETEEKQ